MKLFVDKLVFTIFEKISVNGEETHPIYAYLKSKCVIDDHPEQKVKGDIPWNFAKFLVDPLSGKVAYYIPEASPDSIRSDI